MEIPGNNLKVMIVGSGGREHALAWKLALSPFVERIYCAPGNGGTYGANKTRNIDITAMDFGGITRFCQEEKIDLVVVGPDNPIAEGLVDVLQLSGVRVFGPTQQAARLESSKVFAKEFMAAHHLPTARYAVCNSLAQGMDLVAEHPWARVIKVDGLALGKGVFVCDSQDEAQEALLAIFKEKRFGQAGQQVVIEERLAGEELSLLLFCDGKTIVPMPACQDHKRRFDGDRGPNTGGMGAYSPVALWQVCHEEIEEQILSPVRKALQTGQLSYQGVLYIGLMVVTRQLEENVRAYQPYVLEFNARFGDPEAQALLPLMQTDLLRVLWACTEGKLHEVEINWLEQASCCVVAVADCYPQSSSSGQPIAVGNMPDEKTVVFHSGSRFDGTKLVTSGGRILSVTAIAPDMEAAVAKAYAGMKGISFAGMDYRLDIARRALTGCLSA